MILNIFEESYETYGSPKITACLRKQGTLVSQKRVARRMKELGIRSIVVKKFNHAGNKKSDNVARENLINQDFSVQKPGVKLVGDITYVYTIECGWTYLAIVMDLFDLSVIGYAYDIKMEDDLAIQAFMNAYQSRNIEANAIFHSDQGSQYISNDYEQLLKDLNVKHSYSKKGYQYDNASMEIFNSLIKKEKINHMIFKTFEDAKLTIFEYIEGWYNTRRIHSKLDYKTPKEKYEEYKKLEAEVTM